METNNIIFTDNNRVSKEYQKPELVDLNDMGEAEAACSIGINAAATGCQVGSGDVACVDGSIAGNCTAGGSGF